jgi:mRNA interferase MazF
MMPEQGDLVLIPIPFTDLSSRKRRPVIVISNDAYNRGGLDVVVVAMTSRLSAGAFAFQLNPSDMVEGSLNHPGTVRVDKIYTLAKSIIAIRQSVAASSGPDSCVAPVTDCREDVVSLRAAHREPNSSDAQR